MNGSPYLAKPGVHSHNLARQENNGSTPESRPISKVRLFLFIVGLTCLGYYGYTLADQSVYQAYANWAFDQQIAGRQGITFRDYLREKTPFGFLAGTREGQVPAPVAVPRSTVARIPAEGSVLGRVTIERLNLSAVVRQGVSDETLRESVGHVPSTALAGRDGNFAIAAHRDTLFRALKDIQSGDVVRFQSPEGLFNYRVVATKIVKPTDVSVLRPDGGGFIHAPEGAGAPRILTMITCYPFYYVGSAPQRFIVEAEAVSSK